MPDDWVVIAYRKICDADRQAIEAGNLLPRRFELHTGLIEPTARNLFRSYAESPQVLAVELYGPAGLVARYDALVELTTRRLMGTVSDLLVSRLIDAYLQACNHQN